MSLYSCPDCSSNRNCNLCFRYISAKNEIIQGPVVDDYQSMQLFQMGNIVYYWDKNPIFTQKNQIQKLNNFPSIDFWKEWNLNNKKVKIVVRDIKTNNEIQCYGKLKIYQNILTIIPQEKNEIFISIIGDTIRWNSNSEFYFIYISCEELCYISQKIMHDETLSVDLEKNKIKVTYPIPKPPKDSKNSYVLQVQNEEIKWVLINS